MYNIIPSKPISLSYENNDNELTHKFTVNWMKSVSEKVKKISMVTFMKYTTSTVKDGYGIVYSEGSGYDLADLNMVGVMEIKTGLNALNHPPTSNSTLNLIKFFLYLTITSQKHYCL